VPCLSTREVDPHGLPIEFRTIQIQRHLVGVARGAGAIEFVACHMPPSYAAARQETSTVPACSCFWKRQEGSKWLLSLSSQEPISHDAASASVDVRNGSQADLEIRRG